MATTDKDLAKAEKEAAKLAEKEAAKVEKYKKVLVQLKEDIKETNPFRLHLHKLLDELVEKL